MPFGNWKIIWNSKKQLKDAFCPFTTKPSRIRSPLCTDTDLEVLPKRGGVDKIKTWPWLMTQRGGDQRRTLLKTLDLPQQQMFESSRNKSPWSQDVAGCLIKLLCDDSNPEQSWTSHVAVRCVWFRCQPAQRCVRAELASPALIPDWHKAAKTKPFPQQWSNIPRFQTQQSLCYIRAL